jgi:diacylglycerol kinase (ATP)
MNLLSKVVLAFLLLFEFTQLAAQPKKKICFIINPISGTGKQKKIETLIAKHLDHSFFDYQIAYTKEPKHATILSREAVANLCDIIAIVGGDGSINEAAQGMIGSSAALAIIPTGSGNGLAGHFHIPLNPKKAIGVINKLHTQWIDTVKINEQSYLCVAGVGFDAAVSSAFAHLGKRGFSSYVRVFLNELPHYKPKEYELLIDGVSYKRRAFLICFANGNQYGNNAYIAPQAKIDDGYLDVTILKQFPKHATPKLLHELFHKKIDHSEYIETIRCQNVIIKKPSCHIHLDGEPMELEGDIFIRILPSSLKILTP